MADDGKRIIELEEITTLTDNDYIAVDNSASGGKTKKFKPKNLQDATNQVLEDVAYLTWENNHYYNRGDIVAYEGYLYVCKVDEATYGSFERSDWKKTFVERWGRDLFFDISSQEMTFSDSEYTLPYSKGDVVYRYYPHPSNDGFQMRFYVAKADYPNGVTEYVASQWDEYLSLSEVVDALNKETNKSVDEALALGTASGSIATFTDGSTLPMKKLEVDIEPVQSGSGEPSPTNVRPISGWDECNVTRTGKNLFDKTMTLENGFIGDSGQVVIANQYKHTQLIKIKPNTSYVGSGYLSSGSGYLTTVAYYDKNQNFISQATMGAVAPYSMTTPQNASYLILSGNAPQVDTIQLEEGTTATTYEPYNGATYTIDLDGTRYGGTLDVVSGVLTVDRVSKTFDGSESWDIYTNTGVNQLYTSVPNAMSSSSKVCTLCDNYNSISISNRANNYNTCYSGSNSICFNIENTTVAEWKALLQANNVTVVYELATPQTIQLTPTEVKSLLAMNNIFADTGDILDATYVRNANITINDLIRRIEALES